MNFNNMGFPSSSSQKRSILLHLRNTHRYSKRNYLTFSSHLLSCLTCEKFNCHSLSKRITQRLIQFNSDQTNQKRRNIEISKKIERRRRLLWNKNSSSTKRMRWPLYKRKLRREKMNRRNKELLSLKRCSSDIKMSRRSLRTSTKPKSKEWKKETILMLKLRSWHPDNRAK